MPRIFKKDVAIPAVLWCSVIIWMAIIFMFSAQTGDSSSDLSGGFTRFLAGLFVDGFEYMDAFAQENVIESFSYPIRKLAHFTEYLILGVLLFSAIKSHGKSNRFATAISIFISFLYAVSDEIHQYFVPDRACRFTDVMIDTSGAIAGAVICIILMQIIMQNAKRKTQN